MTDHEWADQFNQDVDAILRGATPPVPASAPPAYPALLDLAHRLHQTDFSAASQVRAPLRQRLVTPTAARPSPRLMLRAPSWVAAVPLMLGLCVVLAALWSGTAPGDPPVLAGSTATTAWVASSTPDGATQTPARPPGASTPASPQARTHAPTEPYTPTGTPPSTHLPAAPSGTPWP